MRLKRLLVVATAAGALLPASPAAAQNRCFEPPTDPSSRDPKNYEDFLAKPLPARAEEVVDFQPIEKGWFDANIDYYYVTFTRPKDVTLKDFFKRIRTKFPDFASGILKQAGLAPYGGGFSILPDLTEFGADPNPRLRDINAKAWGADNPTGALMSFNLGNAWGATERRADKADVIFEKAGDVQVVCASDTDFIFATVTTKTGGKHPVSGRRGFGLMTDPSNADQWIFYSMAADRNSLAAKNVLLWRPYTYNLFCKGHVFWTGFFSEFRTFIYEQRLKVVNWSLKNHGPGPYPFEQGPYKALNCGTKTEPTPKR